jgi:nicotinamide-nucleotide amidase
MNAEIIAVGTELLGASRLDTNSLFLTDGLNTLGVEVTRKSVVGDDVVRVADAVRAALDQAGLVILSGGLGPTEDDVTRDAVALALGRGLEFSQAIADQIEARFAQRRRKMVEINKRQAFLIAGAIKLDNHNGTAPGQWIEHGDQILMLLPGPPNELKPLFETECVPRLTARLPQQFIRTRAFRVAGMPESDLDQLIAPAYRPYTSVTTTILAAAGDIQIHLRARCANESDALDQVEELGQKIEELLGDRLYSRNGDPLEAVVGSMLRERGASLAVAESCTGGLLGARLTDVPGSSDYFVGGFEVYTDAMKTRLLGIDARLIASETAVSEAVANAMARGAREKTGATHALSVTGEAGPQSATPGVEPGTVWVGLATPETVRASLFHLPGNRNRVREFAVQAALNLLRRAL